MGLFNVVDPPAAALRKRGGSLLDSLLKIRANCESMVFLVDQLILEFLCQVLLFGLQHFLALAEGITNAVDHALDPAIKQFKIL